MKHFIEHLLGLCGETHLNIFSIILIIAIFKLSYEAISKLGRNIPKSRKIS